MDGVRVGRYHDFPAGIRGASLSRRANAGLRLVQHPSAVAAGNGRGVISAVVIHDDHFVRTQEILVVQGLQGRLEVSGFVVGRYYDREAVRAGDVVSHHGQPGSVAVSGTDLISHRPTMLRRTNGIRHQKTGVRASL
ncbi:MAG: hypothetical protein K0R13_3530 [Propionibacteriaceae bacterium]|nr:hypothetical protein [Propionibacteriaceae bacterium]